MTKWFSWGDARSGSDGLAVSPYYAAPQVQSGLASDAVFAHGSGWTARHALALRSLRAESGGLIRCPRTPALPTDCTLSPTCPVPPGGQNRRSAYRLAVRLVRLKQCRKVLGKSGEVYAITQVHSLGYQARLQQLCTQVGATRLTTWSTPIPQAMGRQRHLTAGD